MGQLREGAQHRAGHGGNSPSLSAGSLSTFEHSLGLCWGLGRGLGAQQEWLLLMKHQPERMERFIQQLPPRESSPQRAPGRAA